MRASSAQLVALAAAGAVLLLGAAWRQRDRARHLAVPLLADPTLPAPSGVELPELAGCGAAEVARVGSRITALLEARDGALWIGTFDGGLFRGGAEVLEVAGLRGRERFVNALAEHDGLLWVATQGGLLALDGERRVLTLLAGEGVPALARGGTALYAGTARGPFRVTVGAGAEPLGAVGPSGEPLRVTALAAGASRLWIGTASGAYSLPVATLEAPLLSREARWHPLVFGDPAAETNVVTALAPLADGAVAGTDDGGIVRLRADGGVTALRFTDARANEVNPGAAAVEPGGAALLGTQGGGLLVAHARGAAVEASRVGGLGRAEASAVALADDGILVGTAAGVVSELRCGPRLTDRGGPASAGTSSLLLRPADHAHPSTARGAGPGPNRSRRAGGVVALRPSSDQAPRERGCVEGRARMLTRFGKPAAPGDAVDLMVECHERIRSFLALARRIGEASDASDAEVREAAQRVHRYFTQALPLHAEDEERSIRPRLLGREPAVDAELSRMMQEHEEHGPPLSALLAACDALVADPGRLAELRRPLLAATGELERHFVLHLEREEKVIFPAMRRLLDKATDAIIVDEIRGRRGVGPLAEREGLPGADPARR